MENASKKTSRADSREHLVSSAEEEDRDGMRAERKLEKSEESRAKKERGEGRSRCLTSGPNE